MYRCMAAVVLMGFIGPSLSAQSGPPKDTLAFNPVGRYRVEILSPFPRGEWAGLIEIRSVDGHYEGAFTNPDGPGSYPVESVTVRGNVLTITMTGEAAGSVFQLTVTGDSVVGDMTSVTNGLTRVTGRRLKP